MASHYCDNGWVHLCGGPHAPAGPDDDRELIPVPAEGCFTIRCDKHCSCFGADGVHSEECALNGPAEVDPPIQDEEPANG